ncbi:MAG: ilvA [Verrucomicrobia bacterium]|jgi:threonine dehydratase|nr:ilvA [Verrucomicrobiota bacterium]
MLPTMADVQAAAVRIQPWIHRTPVMTSISLDALSGAQLWFKCENLQKAGAFKARGATNAVLQLSPEAAARGVATHSSGNHGAALALAASRRGIPSYVVMPENASEVKRRAVLNYGGKVITCAPNLASREETLAQVLQETGAVFIPPYNHPHVIAGQGTAALELLEEVPELDVVIAPVGGGGLLSGTALVVHSLRPAAQTWGAEPALANDAFLSLQNGRIMPVQSTQTIADGLRSSLGEMTFAMIQQYVPKVLTVSEEDIIRAMRLLWERMKIVVEPSGALPLAAVLTHPEEVKGRRLGLILSGGNVDLDHLPWVTK